MKSFYTVLDMGFSHNDPADRGKITMCKSHYLSEVTAVDSKGYKYKKRPFVYLDSAGRKILSFGGYCEYELRRLIGWIGNDKSKGLCIDAQGLNHGGWPNVMLNNKDLHKVLKEAREVKI